MQQKNLSKVFWTEALTGGLVTGILLFVWALVGYWLNMPMNHSGIASFGQFLILGGAIYYFGRRMREFRGPALGYSYGTAFGFTMAMMLFVGVVYGIGEFFLQVVIAPAYYREVMEIALLNSSFSEELVEQTLKSREMFSGIMNSPVFYIFSFVFSMCLYGGLIGLILSAFLKRAANPFADDRTNDYNPGF